MALNLTVEVNYVQHIEWRRISADHIQFNCTLACRSAIGACVVELNKTMYTNRSLIVSKENFSSWAIVDFFSLDAYQPFTYMVSADDNAGRILGMHVHGNIPPVSTEL